MKYYINQAEKLFLTTRELRQRIKNNEFERLDESTKKKLKEKMKLKDQPWLYISVLIIILLIVLSYIVIHRLLSK